MDEEIDAINIQLVTLVATIFSIIISIITTYNQKLKLENKDTIYSAEELYKITLFNRTLVLIIAIVFLYVNYKLYKISKKQGENLKPYTLQIYASILTIAAEIIVLYVVKLSSTETVSDVENPII